MRKILLSMLMVLVLTFPAYAATYYAINAGGNWSAGGTWSTISAKDASRVGGAVAPTSVDDCILDDYSGNVTVSAASSAKSGNCVVNGNYAGILTFNSGQTLTMFGNLTFSATMTIAGTGNLTFNSSATIISAGIASTIGSLTLMSSVYTLDTNGTTWTQLILSSSSKTVTFASALQATTLNISISTTFAGGFDITCDTLIMGGSIANQYAFISGKTITAQTNLYIFSNPILPGTFKSATPTSAALLVYNGTAANCKVAGIIFTDINASGSAVPILNWYGGTLTRTDNIYNVTAASFPAVDDVENVVEYGGVDDASTNRLTGTLAAGGGGAWAQ